MLIQFTIGTAVTTLADDQNTQGGGKIAYVLDGLTMDSSVPVIALFRAPTPKKLARENIDTKFSFKASQSLATRAGVLSYIKTINALVNAQGSLVLTEGASTVTGANAILKSARINPGETVGTRITFQYLFELTTLT